jgi:hypothetical protein
VQLADATEATSSALRPSTEEDIEKLVTKIVDEHLKEGQLDNSGLTLGDIMLIRESFIETLQGRFHVRVKYPGNDELMGVEPAPEGNGQPTESEDTPVTATEPEIEPQPELEAVDELL